MLQFAHYALRLKGAGVVGMTVNIGKDVQARLLAYQTQAKRLLSQSLSRHLHQALGRKVEFWFAFEVHKRLDSADGFLHFHGELACEPHEHAIVKKVLRKVGGNFPSTAKQVRLDGTIDDGWVSYALKDYRIAVAAFLNRVTQNRASWQAHPDFICTDPVFISAGLKSEAKRLYEAVRPYVTLH